MTLGQIERTAKGTCNEKDRESLMDAEERMINKRDSESNKTENNGGHSREPELV